MGQDVLAWKTGHVRASAEEIVQTTARLNPLGRNATEADVAEAVLFFVSDEAAFLTGTSLDVDGGAHLGMLPGAD
jgi:NAD(P)-dependent dehydrogenase (short-subunit alcohol dehydrogenase family)